MQVIYLQYEENSFYPGRNSLYHPHSIYPEYPWNQSDISLAINPVYEMVRECLHGLGMDVEHFGQLGWNPLGDLIRHGDTVLIKPNWVSHRNKNPEIRDDLECLVTHPSVVRAVFDYVSIALSETGKIIIADAPMQGTDLDALFDIAGYRELFNFISQKNANVAIADLRKYRVQEKNGVLSKPFYIDDSAGSVTVELDKGSAHSENDSKAFSYKVSDYLTEETKAFHASGRHAYEINRYALEADVIINLPKPKCHRLAGMTGAMKNMVGIIYDKASLPHRAEGDTETGAGDAYEKRSLLKRWMHEMDDRKIMAEREGKVWSAKLSDLVAKACYIVSRTFKGDGYRIGGWYANDTVWRTVADLYRIILFADMSGRMQNEPQRRILTVGDMIVCGDKDGPIGPSPKKLGVIMASDSMVLFDKVICRIMGFDEEKIKSLSWLESNSAIGKEEVLLHSNIPEVDAKPLDKLTFSAEWHFEPHSCWKGHIERQR